MAEELRRDLHIRAILVLVGVALLVAASVAYWVIQVLRLG